jgi:long-chain-fatty-acyl-CoA reductase
VIWLILYKGSLFENKEQNMLIDTLYLDCKQTLATNEPISTDVVIHACDLLYKRVMNHEFDDIIFPLLTMMNVSYSYFLDMARMFSREGLEYKCKIELGDNHQELSPLKSGVKRYRYPLGILFHISAGNVDGLPAYSVIEGLLTGNINILKLPTGDSGLSVKLLFALIQTEPKLADYIYVFDVPSTETATLRRFASIADGIVVWGGDKAVEAARKMAEVNTKIIAWGHKLSFAYATNHASNEDLYNLAKHICQTNQLLCTSCQGIFLDTELDTDVEQFAIRFFEILKKANFEVGFNNIGIRGRHTLQIYNDVLENKYDKIYKQDGISVIIGKDSKLELSYLFRNIWIKKLPHESILMNLKDHKNHLQTCGLLCSVKEREKLAKIIASVGVVRITKGNMSIVHQGEAHDGTYALREYTRIVEIEE